MDLLNMTNRDQIQMIVLRLNILFFLNLDFSNFVANQRYSSYEKIQNFNSISQHGDLGCQYHCKMATSRFANF